MVRLKDLINEGVTSSELYHLTGLKNAINILKNDQFVLGNTFFGGRDLDFQKGKHYYISMARTKFSGYIQKHAGNTSVIFELDGRGLGQNYRTVNANYFEKGEHEGEERLIHNDPVIENATGYIKSAHVLLRNSNILSDKQREYIKFLAEYGEKRNVPVYFYDEMKYWSTQRSKYARDIEEFDPLNFPSFIYPKTYKLSDRLKKFINGDIDEKLKNLEKRKFDSLVTKLKDEARKVLKTPRYNDWKRKLQDRLDNFNVKTIHELAKKIRKGKDYTPVHEL